MKTNSLTNTATKVILNVGFVAILLLMTLHATAYDGESLQFSPRNMIMGGLYFVCFVGICYLNSLMVTPRTLMRGHRGAFFVALASEVATVIVLGAALSSTLPDNTQHGLFDKPWVIVCNVLGSVLLISLVLMSTSVYEIAVRAIERRQCVEALQRLRRQTELDALRRQVSPHFIFNMLTNVITLIHISPAEGALLLAKLRSLLNYQIVECKEEFMPLDREIAHLREFLDIESVRHDDMEVSMRVDGDLRQMRLPALLFLPVVENAVKHNIPDDGLTPYIHINVLNSEVEGRLTFVCENSCGHQRSPKGGLGLKVLKKRLELLYPGRHTLHIDETSTKYTLTLTIETR